MSLQVQILIGIILGALTGLFFGEYAHVLHPIGTAFVMLLKMSVLPLMACALIHAVGRLSVSQARRVLKACILSLLLVWTVVIGMAYVVSFVFPVKDNPSYFSTLISPEDSHDSLLGLFIPINPIHALANDVVPGVVFFSLLFAVALMRRQRKKTLLETLDVIVAVLTNITEWITRLSPIGAFALIAVTAGTMPVDQFSKIRLYFFAYLLGICTLVFFVFPLLVQALTPVRGRRFLEAIRPAFLLAFTTGNTIITLPHILKALQELAQEERLPAEDAEHTAESVVPLAYNFPTVGNLFTILYMLFLSFFFALPFSPMQHLRLVSLGMPVLFGSGNTTLNAVAFLLDALKLPLDGLTLFVETMPLTRNFQMLGSSTGIAVVALLAMFSYCGRLKFRPTVLLRGLAGIAVMLVVAILLIRYAAGEPPVTKPVFGGLTLRHAVPSKIADAQTLTARQLPPELRLDEIQQSGELRVGFSPEIPPFAYYNDAGELVGYDIAFAHDLARTLDVKLVFVPFVYATLPEDLETGIFDIAMAATSITPERMKRLNFSQAYLSPPRVLVVEDYRRHNFASYDRLRARKDLSIAVLRGSSLVAPLQEQFPNAEVVTIDRVLDFLKPGVADALYFEEAPGTTLSLIFPRYTVVTTDKSLGREHFGYPVPSKATQWQDYVMLWLDIKKLDGFSDKQYAYWVEGKVDNDAPRWSIIRDVLGWVD